MDQRNGTDTLEPTKEVVASPPITTLQPGRENLIRVVRTSGKPVQSEESYRLIVDELPDPSRRQPGTVTFVVRQSIPVFFAAEEVAGAIPSWTVERQRGGFAVTVQNSGAKRLKISDLTLSSGGTAVAQRAGLVGYVLGKSAISWFVPSTRRGALAGNSVSITAHSEAGRFDATARLQGR